MRLMRNYDDISRSHDMQPMRGSNTRFDQKLEHSLMNPSCVYVGSSSMPPDRYGSSTMEYIHASLRLYRKPIAVKVERAMTQIRSSNPLPWL